MSRIKSLMRRNEEEYDLVLGSLGLSYTLRHPTLSGP